MIYGSIRVHMGPYGPICVARGEKNNVKRVKIIISESDFSRVMSGGLLNSLNFITLSKITCPTF